MSTSEQSAAASAGGALFVAAHPDDELIGAATELSGRRAVGVVHVTDGAPRDLRDARARGFDSAATYAAARRAEAESALAMLGIAAEHVIALDVADQEAHQAVPQIARALAALLRARAPARVYAHPYEGGHSDHDAAAVATHAALALLARQGCTVPALFEFTSYHACAAGSLAHGVFLCPNAATGPAPLGPLERRVRLDETARARKRALLAQHRTQADVLGQFASTEERFRPAPRYHFTRAPHDGPLLYERLGLGPSGEAFRAEVARGLASLDLDPEAAL